MDEQPPFLEEDALSENDLPGGWSGAGVYSRGGGPSTWRILITVIGAIVTGGLFGYLLLTLFTGEPLFAKDGPSASAAVSALAPADGSQAPSATPAADTPQPSAAASAVSAAAASDSSAAAATSAANSTLVPASSYFMLQYGVFGTEESMNDALKELQAQGIPAATDTTDGFRVYAGIAPAKADAEDMANRLSGVEVYVKSVDNDQIDMSQSAHAAEWSAFLKSSSALYLKIAAITSTVLAGPADGKANDADIQAVEKAYQTWLGLADQSGSWDQTAATSAAAETKHMGEAVAALDQYAGKPSVPLLRQAQTAAMQAAIADRQLRETLRLEIGG